MACSRSSDCGDGAKDASRKTSEVGGVRSENIGSLSPSPPGPPLFFSPVCDFAPHFTNSPEQASSLATSHIVISNNISFLPLLNLDLSLLYWQLPPPPETNHIKGWMQMDSALQCVIRDHNRLTDMLPDIQKTVKRNVCGVPLCNF